MAVTLVTSPIATGTAQAAQVFAQQAAAAGVHVTLSTQTPTTLYGPQYLRWVFAQDVWNYWPYLTMVSQSLLSTAPYNETHFRDPTYERLYQEALATTNPTLRTTLQHEMMTIDYEDGGFIIPYFVPVIDGYSKNVGGVTASRTGLPFGNYAFDRMWLS